MDRAGHGRDRRPANAEPVRTIDAIEAAADTLRRRAPAPDDADAPAPLHRGRTARTCAMSAGFSRRTAARRFTRGDCDLVPNSFSDVPRLMRQTLSPRLVLTAVSPPDRHGYFSLGPHAEYTASFIGEVPFFVEVNPSVPRTFGGNQLHISDIVGYCEADTPLVEVQPPAGDRARPQDRLAGRRADSRRRHAAGRHRRSARPGAGRCSSSTASWACTPSCSATASSTSSSAAR